MCIRDRTEAALRRVLNIPDNYKVGFIQGGASTQFAMVPMNLMTTGEADYLVTGQFSGKAAKEAEKFGTVHVVASSKDENFTYIPDVDAVSYNQMCIRDRYNTSLLCLILPDGLCLGKRIFLLCF